MKYHTVKYKSMIESLVRAHLLKTMTHSEVSDILSNRGGQDEKLKRTEVIDRAVKEIEEIIKGAVK